MSGTRPRAGANSYIQAQRRAKGLHFEQIIEAGCDYYRARDLADIEKTPEPMKPIENLGHGKFLAVYAKAGQADFKGLLRGGRAINFEAKKTDGDRITAKYVTDTQARKLERTNRLGGIAFVLVCFGAIDVFRIPWPVWRDMKQKFGRKYILQTELEPFRVRYSGTGALLFLEGLIV